MYASLLVFVLMVLCIQNFLLYFLSTYYVPDEIVGIEDSVVSPTDRSPVHMELPF